MDFLQKFKEALNLLTLEKIILFIFLILIVGISGAVWENKNSIYRFAGKKFGINIATASVIELSDKNKKLIDNTVGTSSQIISIQIYNVNFRKNVKSLAYFSSNNNIVTNTINNYQTDKISDIPLLTNNESNNLRITNVINGQFFCIPFKDTIESIIYPNLATTVESVCEISIPPRYGRFVGYMSIYLKSKPTIDDIERLRQIASNISSSIFDTDIVEKTIN